MSKKQQRVLWPVLTILLITASAFVFASARSGRGALSDTEVRESRQPNAGSISASAVANEITPTAAQSLPLGPKHGPVQVVRFTLYDAGIYPREARVDKGLVAIIIEDLSGGTGGLIVARDNGNSRSQVGGVQRFEHHWRGRSELEMTPGRYVVYDLSRPLNHATLIVEP